MKKKIIFNAIVVHLSVCRMACACVGVVYNVRVHIWYIWVLQCLGSWLFGPNGALGLLLLRSGTCSAIMCVYDVRVPCVITPESAILLLLLNNSNYPHLSGARHRRNSCHSHTNIHIVLHAGRVNAVVADENKKVRTQKWIKLKPSSLI